MCWHCHWEAWPGCEGHFWRPDEEIVPGLWGSDQPSLDVLWWAHLWPGQLHGHQCGGDAEEPGQPGQDCDLHHPPAQQPDCGAVWQGAAHGWGQNCLSWRCQQCQQLSKKLWISLSPKLQSCRSLGSGIIFTIFQNMHSLYFQALAVVPGNEGIGRENINIVCNTFNNSQEGREIQKQQKTASILNGTRNEITRSPYKASWGAQFRYEWTIIGIYHWIKSFWL